MVDANTEEDYSEFHRRIETYVTDVETHLNLPPGTVGFLGASRDSDFVFVLKMCGVIEPLIKEAVRESVRQAIEHPETITSGSEALMKAINDLGIDRLRAILFEFGTIDAKDSSFVQALFSIRNRYAHHIANAVLSVREVLQPNPMETDNYSRSCSAGILKMILLPMSSTMSAISCFITRFLS
jgi:hypothetical protein